MPGSSYVAPTSRCAQCFPFRSFPLTPNLFIHIMERKLIRSSGHRAFGSFKITLHPSLWIDGLRRQSADFRAVFAWTSCVISAFSANKRDSSSSVSAQSVHFLARS